MMKEYQRKQISRMIRGFTLVEMLLVATLLGLLAAVAIPKMGQLFRDQKSERALLDTAMLNQALGMWRADNPSLDIYNGTDGAISSYTWSTMDLAELAQRYEMAGVGFARQGPTGLGETAFALIAPYAGQATSSTPYLIDVAGEELWQDHVYIFDTATEQFKPTGLSN